MMTSKFFFSTRVVLQWYSILMIMLDPKFRKMVSHIKYWRWCECYYNCDVTKNVFLLHKNGPINVDCHIYKILSCFKWLLKIIIFWKNPNWETERQISLVLWIRKFLKYVTMWKGFHIALFPFLALRKLMIQGAWIHAKTLRMKIW